MKTLHSGKNLTLTLECDMLSLQVNWGGRITHDQIALVEAKGMTEKPGEDTWYGDAKHRAELVELVKLIDGQWVSREAERLAMQQIRGGR